MRIDKLILYARYTRIFKIKHSKIDWEFYAESAINQHMPQAEKAN